MDRRLPDVLVQLIAQHLFSTDKIRLARCSTRLVHAINNAFAWRDAISPLRFCLPPRPLTAVPPLLRHSLISVRVESTRHPRPDELTSLAALMASCRLAELDLSQCSQVTLPQWTFLRDSIVLQQPTLHSLSLYQDLVESNAEVLELVLRAAPQLQSLRFRTLNDNLGARSCTGAGLLSTLLPHLTDLSVADSSLDSWSSGRHLMTLVLRNVHLRSLSILRPQLYDNDGGWVSFFADPVAQGLQRLCLHTYFPRGRTSKYAHGQRRQPVPAAQMIAAFCSLHSLRVLELVHVADVDAMLPHVRFIPVLRSLLIVPDCSLPPLPLPPTAEPKAVTILDALAPSSQKPRPAPVVDLNEHPLPSVGVLTELMRDAPQLRCKITMPRSPLTKGASKQQKTLEQHLDKLAAPFTAASPLFDEPSVARRFTFTREEVAGVEGRAS